MYHGTQVRRGDSSRFRAIMVGHDREMPATSVFYIQSGRVKLSIVSSAGKEAVIAEMVWTTRSRVNFFMNKFRKLGFIEYNGGLKINAALLSVVLHE